MNFNDTFERLSFVLTLITVARVQRFARGSHSYYKLSSSYFGRAAHYLEPGRKIFFPG